MLGLALVARLVLGAGLIAGGIAGAPDRGTGTGPIIGGLLLWRCFCFPSQVCGTPNAAWHLRTGLRC